MARIAKEVAVTVRDMSQGNGRPQLLRRALFAVLFLALAPTLPGAAAPTDKWDQYNARSAKSILELQPFRQEEQAASSPSGVPIRLIALNPQSNAWFLLAIGSGEGKAVARYHIENPDPRLHEIHLSARPPVALVISGNDGDVRCEPWTGYPTALDSARASGLAYAPLCGGRLYLRNPVAGTRTTLERTTDYLRDHVWKGDQIVGFVRDTFFRDSFVESGKGVAADGTAPETQGPTPAAIAPSYAGQAVIPADFGLGLAGAPSGRMTLGRWYPVADMPGIHASVILPKAISDQVLHGPGKTNPLDQVEAGAFDYMVAFDLSRFDLHFTLGTDHPRLGWSPRPPAAARDSGLPGPDGVRTAEPLARTGMVSPALARRTVATFAAGFKREHGAFKWGELSTRNHGSHYGFIEQGVIFSKLQPGLATLFVLDDGSVDMKTWAQQDDRLLSRTRFARQNGVALLEPGPLNGETVPGPLVTQWGPGNWSGSADMQLRTLRAGACLQESRDKRFLIYGYFSTATPSAMARTFQAFDCHYAMQLDMNALEHTYLALYVRRGDEVQIQHLVPGMSAVDQTGPDGKLIPRFIGFPDNRDFFYLTRKGDTP